MKRPRVMQLIVGGDIGGAERLVVDLASHPEDSGADHEIALFTPNPGLRELFRSAGLVVHDRGKVRENPLAYLYRSLSPFDVRWLATLLEARRVDILHTHTLGSHVLGTRAARRARCLQLRTEHHVMHYEDPTSAAFTRWAATRTDRFVAVSHYVRGVLARTAASVAERMSVVPNGIDTSHFSPLPPRPETPFSAAILCRLTAWKRVEWAVRASAVANVNLVVVGDGEEQGRLVGLARKERAPVRFVGYQKDTRPFFAACDVTINASKADPMPISVLESLSMERPVIAFEDGGIPEVVEHDETGWLLQHQGVEPLAQALLRAKAERSRLPAMGVAGRHFVLSKATTTRMCGGYAAEYERLGRLP